MRYVIFLWRTFSFASVRCWGLQRSAKLLIKADSFLATQITWSWAGSLCACEIWFISSSTLLFSCRLLASLPWGGFVYQAPHPCQFWDPTLLVLTQFTISLMRQIVKVLQDESGLRCQAHHFGFPPLPRIWSLLHCQLFDASKN